MEVSVIGACVCLRACVRVCVYLCGRYIMWQGISAEPVSELNMLQWSARLCGLPDTPWEGI